MERVGAPASHNLNTRYLVSFRFILIPMTILGMAEILGLTQIASVMNKQQQKQWSNDAPLPASMAEKKQPYHYDPSPLERYFLDNAKSLDLYNTSGVATCPIVINDTSPVNTEMLHYFDQLQAYNTAVNHFQPIPSDLRTQILPDGSNIEEVCEATKLHPQGLSGIFVNNGISSSSDAGGMEPLLPMMRSTKMCGNYTKPNLMSLDYLIHDFHSICKRLRRHTRTVFVDMGASLAFHNRLDSPAVYINKIYRKFGIHFDHIYAYEITPTKPEDAYAKVPEELMSSFHWINLGVDPTPGAKMNPFTTVVKNFNEDDFVVVKLDIDTPAIEHVLADQLRTDDDILKIVDVFYYEHHVMQTELLADWKASARGGTVGESLDLMSDIRQKGVAAHYWP